MGNKLKSIVDRLLEWVLIVLVAANVLNVLWQVFTRFVLHDPSSYTEELARYLLIWVGLLGAAYAVGKKKHLAIDLVPRRLNPRARKNLEICIQALIYLFALCVMVVGGLRLVAITWTLDQVSAALQIKLGTVYLVLPLSGLLIMYYSLNFIVERLVNKSDPFSEVDLG